MKKLWKKGLVLGLIYPLMIICLNIFSLIPILGKPFYFILIIIQYPLRILQKYLSFLFIRLFYGSQYMLREKVFSSFCFKQFNCTENCYRVFIFCDTLIITILALFTGLILGFLIGYILDKKSK